MKLFSHVENMAYYHTGKTSGVTGVLSFLGWFKYLKTFRLAFPGPRLFGITTSINFPPSIQIVEISNCLLAQPIKISGLPSLRLVVLSHTSHVDCDVLKMSDIQRNRPDVVLVVRLSSKERQECRVRLLRAGIYHPKLVMVDSSNFEPWSMDFRQYTKGLPCLWDLAKGDVIGGPETWY